jgi:NAD(P)-dependent dehydrogenase (short-subunit alcohol dehydrogenase family)
MALAARSSTFLHSALARRVAALRSASVRTVTRAMGATIPEGDHFTMPDQPARFAKGKAENNTRMLTTDFYDGSFLKDQRVLVTGGNRGIGLALVKELVACGANVIVTCRSSNDELAAMKNVQVIENCDVTDTDSVRKMTERVAEPVDVLINNAGYFYEPLETIETMNFEEELKMIDICAVGPLRVSSALWNAGKIKPNGGKIAMITSQGGSVAWRVVQNPTGHDYGHHMSKSAANMGGVLLAQELAPKGVMVQMLHPGFNKTGMTKKYEHIWEVEGAVDASMGAKRVLHEVGLMTPEHNGLFINCEDGLQIPW